MNNELNLDINVEPTLAEQVSGVIKKLGEDLEEVRTLASVVGPITSATPVSTSYGCLADMKFYFEELVKVNELLLGELKERNELPAPEVLPPVHNKHSQQSSCEMSTNAKGELSFSIKVYGDDIDQAIEKAEDSLLSLNDWKDRNWIDSKRLVNEMETKIASLSYELATLKGENNVTSKTKESKKG